MQKLYGTVVPIVTPLTEEDSIDVPSLERLVDHCIDNGLQCLYPCGTTWRDDVLDRGGTGGGSRRASRAVRTATTGTRYSVPMFGAWNLADTVELARHAVEIGADGIGVVAPVFFKLSDRGLIDYYKAVSASVPEDFPICLYGIPQNAVNDINRAVAETVAKSLPQM